MYKTKTLSQWLETATEATIRAAELKFEKNMSWKETFEVIVTEHPNERITFTKMRCSLRKHPDYKKVELEDTGFKEMFSIDGDTFKSVKLLDLNEMQKKDPNYMLNAHGFDPKEYTLIKAQNKKWNVYSKLHGVQQLYSSSIVAEPKVVTFDPNWVQDLLNTLDYSKIKVVKSKEQSGDKCGEFNFPDAHLDKFITAVVSTGYSDITVATERYIKCIEKAIQSVLHIKFDVIKYVVGQDFMNVDNLSGSTTRLTPQDTNVFYETSYKLAFSCFFKTCEMIRSAFPHAKLEIIYIKGNHDIITTFTFAEAIRQIYMATGVNVEVDTTLQKPRKYREYGDTLIGFGHSAKERNRIFECMQKEARTLWHKKYKYFNLSHLHTQAMIEKGGVIYRRLGSTSVDCEWSVNGGWIGSEKVGHVFVYDKVDGRISENYIKI
jgi:hypothetical protein